MKQGIRSMWAVAIQVNVARDPDSTILPEEITLEWTTGVDQPAEEPFAHLTPEQAAILHADLGRALQEVTINEWGRDSAARRM